MCLTNIKRLILNESAPPPRGMKLKNYVQYQKNFDEVYANRKKNFELRVQFEKVNLDIDNLPEKGFVVTLNNKNVVEIEASKPSDLPASGSVKAPLSSVDRGLLGFKEGGGKITIVINSRALIKPLVL